MIMSKILRRLKTKRIGSLLLAIAMLIGILPITALARANIAVIEITANGTQNTVTTTVLTFTFDEDVTVVNFDTDVTIDIENEDEEAITVDSVSAGGDDTEWIVDISGDWIQGETLTVTEIDVDGSDYVFNLTNATVVVNRQATPVTFVGAVQAGGTDNVATSTHIRLQFSGAYPIGLDDSNVSVSDGITVDSVTRDAETLFADVAISGAWDNNDDVDVTLTNPAGYNITPLVMENVVLFRAPTDTTPPVLESATIIGGTLTLTFDEPLNESTSNPAPADFQVRYRVAAHPTDTPDITNVNVSGSTVVLTMNPGDGSAVVWGETVAIAYVPLSGRTIRDLAGNVAGSFGNPSDFFNFENAGVEVTNNTPDVLGNRSGLVKLFDATGWNNRLEENSPQEVRDSVVGFSFDVTGATGRKSFNSDVGTNSPALPWGDPGALIFTLGGSGSGADREVNHWETTPVRFVDEDRMPLFAAGADWGQLIILPQWLPNGSRIAISDLVWILGSPAPTSAVLSADNSGDLTELTVTLAAPPAATGDKILVYEDDTLDNLIQEFDLTSQNVSGTVATLVLTTPETGNVWVGFKSGTREVSPLVESVIRVPFTVSANPIGPADTVTTNRIGIYLEYAIPDLAANDITLTLDGVTREALTTADGGEGLLWNLAISGDWAQGASLRVTPAKDGYLFNPAYQQTALNRDTTPPTIVGTPEIDEDEIEIKFNEALDGDSVPVAAAFTVTGVAAGNTIDEVTISGDTLTIKLDNAATTDDEDVKISYNPLLAGDDPGEGPIQDLEDNEAAAFGPITVDNVTFDATRNVRPVSAVLSNFNRTLTVTLAAAPEADDTIRVYIYDNGGYVEIEEFTIENTNTEQVIVLTEPAPYFVYVTYQDDSLDESTRRRATGFEPWADVVLDDIRANGAAGITTTTTLTFEFLTPVIGLVGGDFDIVNTEEEPIGLAAGGAYSAGSPSEGYRIWTFTIDSGDWDDGDELEVKTIVKDGFNFVLETDTVVVFRDVKAPVLQSATINGTTLVLTYDETLYSGALPAVGDFTVKVNGDEPGDIVTINTVGIATTQVTLTLDEPVIRPDVVTISYTPGTNPIQDAAGNEAEELDGEAVVNNTPAAPNATPPEPVQILFRDAIAALNGGGGFVGLLQRSGGATFGVDEDGKLVVNKPAENYDALDFLLAGAGLADGYTYSLEVDFEISEGGTINQFMINRIPQGWQGLMNAAGPGTMDIGFSMNAGVATVVHKTTSEVFDNVTGFRLNSHPDGGRGDFTIAEIRVKTGIATILTITYDMPALESAVIKDDELVLTFDRELDDGSEPVPGDFVVKYGDDEIAVTYVNIEDDEVILTMASAAKFEQEVTISYTAGTDPIQDEDGRPAANFEDEEVDNITEQEQSPVPSTALLERNNTVLTVTLAAPAAVGDIVRVYDAAVEGELLYTRVFTTVTNSIVININPALITNDNLWVTYRDLINNKSESTRLVTTGFVNIVPRELVEVEVNGTAGTVTTTTMTLKFDENLSSAPLVEDIVLRNTTYAGRTATLSDAPSNTDEDEFEYTINGIWNDEDEFVVDSLFLHGYSFTNEADPVTVHRELGELVTLEKLEADGEEDTADTTKLTLTFDKPVTTLPNTGIYVVNTTDDERVVTITAANVVPASEDKKWDITLGGTWLDEDVLRIVQIFSDGYTFILDEDEVTLHKNSPPALLSAEIDGDVLTLTFDEEIDGDPNKAAFTVNGIDGEDNNVIDDITLEDDMVILTMVKEAVFADIVTVSYNRALAGSPIVDTASPALQAENFTNRAVENKTTPPPYIIDYVNETITLYGGETGIWFNILTSHITTPTRANLMQAVPNDARGHIAPGANRTIRLGALLTASTARDIRTINILWELPALVDGRPTSADTVAAIRAQLLDPEKGARILLTRPSGASLGLTSFNVDYTTDLSGILFNGLADSMEGRKVEVAHAVANFVTRTLANTTGNNPLSPLYSRSGSSITLGGDTGFTGSVRVQIPTPSTTLASTTLFARVVGCDIAEEFASSAISIAVIRGTNTAWPSAYRVGTFINYRGAPIEAGGTPEMFANAKGGSLPLNVTTAFRDRLIHTESTVARWSVPNDGFTYQWRLQSEAAGGVDNGWLPIVGGALLPVEIFNPVLNTNLALTHADLTNPQFQIRRVGNPTFGIPNSVPSASFRTVAHLAGANIGSFNRAAGTLAAGGNGREYLVLLPGITYDTIASEADVLQGWRPVPGNAIPISPYWNEGTVIIVRVAGTAGVPAPRTHTQLGLRSHILLTAANVRVNLNSLLVDDDVLRDLLSYNAATGRLTVNQNIPFSFIDRGYTRTSRLSVSANDEFWFNITATTDIRYIIDSTGRLHVRFQGTSAVAPSASFQIVFVDGQIELP
jgi:uncharacterized repeat protein (TIGR02059 family)